MLQTLRSPGLAGLPWTLLVVGYGHDVSEPDQDKLELNLSSREESLKESL